MKCPNCGGEMSLEQRFCAHCGTENTEARQHAAAMEMYNNEFNQTKAEVFRTAKVQGSLLARFIIIFVMLILIVTECILSAKSYSIVSSRKAKYANKHSEEYLAIMNQYFEEKNYLDLDSFISEKGIRFYTDTPYVEYTHLRNLISDYSYSFRTFEAARYRINNISRQYENPYTRVASTITSFYEQYERYTTSDSYADSISQDEWAKMKIIYDDYNKMVQYYCQFTDEEMADFLSTSNGGRQLAIEQKFVWEQED